MEAKDKRDMKIPNKLKIGGHEYRVVFPYVFTERFDRYADSDDARKIIHISDFDGGGNKRAESGISVSLLHEILHAIDHLTGHEQFFGPDGEKRIEALSEGLFQVLRDNKLRFDQCG